MAATARQQMIAMYEKAAALRLEAAAEADAAGQPETAAAHRQHAAANAQAAAEAQGVRPVSAPRQPRFVVQEFGPKDFCVYDRVTGLSRYPCFTRRGAQQIADRKNAEQAAKEGH